jgi:hypothetical protein
MNILKHRVQLAVAVLLLAVGVADARAEEAARDCLPTDLKLRVAFAEPKRLAEGLREIEGERKRAGKRAVLKRRFEEAGCAGVEEQAGPGLAEPNLICRIPGKRADAIAIGSSPMFDGWTAAALLPELARAIAASPREHSYAIALLSRAVAATPAGAREFAASFAEQPPRVFVHLGMLGSRLPEIGPEASDEQRCVVQSIARAVGAGVETIRAWNQVASPCLASNAQGRAHSPVNTCRHDSFAHFLDVDPFVRADVSVAGLYAFPKRDKTNFSMQQSARLDPVAYVASYRVLAAYTVALDAVLAAPPRAPVPTSEATAPASEPTHAH